MRLTIQADDKIKQANFSYELNLPDATILKTTALICATTAFAVLVHALSDKD